MARGSRIALPKRQLEIAFGFFLLLVSVRFVASLVWMVRLRIAAHEQPVAAHLPAFQPVEEAHAEQARS